MYFILNAVWGEIVHWIGYMQHVVNDVGPLGSI